MAGNRKGVYPTSGKRRKSFYDFSEEYPGTGFERNSKRSTSASMDHKKRLKIAIFVVLMIIVVTFGYFITYTCLNISNEPIKTPDDYINVMDKTTTVTADREKDLTTEEPDTSDENTTLEETTTVFQEMTTDTINE